MSKSTVCVKRKWWKNLYINRHFLIMMLPGLVILFVNKYLPIFGIVIAFKDINYQRGILGSEWVGLKNFEYLFTSSASLEAARNTILYNLAFILGGMILAVSIAIALNELHSAKLKKFYQSVIILPSFISIVIVSYIVLVFLSYRSGVMNSLRTAFGSTPIDWYISPQYWPAILTTVNFWAKAGMGSVLYYASICSIDPEYYEAAVIDGASRFKQIIHITIPHLIPLICIIVILSLGDIFRGDFGLFFQVPLDNKALIPTTEVVDTFVYRALIYIRDIGMSSAASVFQSVVGCVFLLIVNAIIKKIEPSNALF